MNARDERLVHRGQKSIGRRLRQLTSEFGGTAERFRGRTGLRARHLGQVEPTNEYTSMIHSSCGVVGASSALIAGTARSSTVASTASSSRAKPVTTSPAMRTIDANSGPETDEVQQALSDMMDSWSDGLDKDIDDPVRADIIRLVGDGVYLRALLGLPPVDSTRYRKVVERLLER
ncbi:hypothetical protein OIE68_32390 [Nocardia vinacea]|nr:hypothetical protein OIE68_32390 [Nocardia vinacea]